jgi:hypothetical protein
LSDEAEFEIGELGDEEAIARIGVNGTEIQAVGAPPDEA